MTRRVYIWLLRLHPPAFRDRFADEMLAVYDDALGVRGGWSLVARVAVSLFRQWLRHLDVTEPQGLTGPVADAFREHDRCLTLELQFTRQVLVMMAFAFAVDQRMWFSAPLRVLAGARAAWLANRRHRDGQAYVRRLLTARHAVRFNAWRRLERSRRSTAWVSFTIAGTFAFSCLADVIHHYRHGRGTTWAVHLALALLWFQAHRHHRQLTEIQTREIAAIARVQPDKSPRPLGLFA